MWTRIRWALCLWKARMHWYITATDRQQVAPSCCKQTLLPKVHCNAGFALRGFLTTSMHLVGVLQPLTCRGTRRTSTTPGRLASQGLGTSLARRVARPWPCWLSHCSQDSSNANLPLLSHFQLRRLHLNWTCWSCARNRLIMNCAVRWPIWKVAARGSGSR